MKLKFIGAAQTVTGSKTMVTFRDQKFLVDCGMFQGPKEMRVKNWESFPEAKNLNCVILTHAHLDHSGYLPKLVKDGFAGPIFCSSGTADLCKILLLDAGHLQEEDANFANRTGHSHHQPALPLYTEQDALRVLPLLKTIEREKWTPLAPMLNMILERSGHIIGSSFIQLSVSLKNGNKIVTFSGDVGNGRSQTLKSPVSILETDYLVLESTYGNRTQSRNDPTIELGAIINKVIGRGGVLVIPAFSVGRTQEILFLIRKLEEQKIIPTVPVYLDSPMAASATEVFLKHPEDHQLVLNSENELDSPICTNCYNTVRNVDESMLLCMRDGPMIVISAAGMLTGGRVLHHLKHRLPNRKNAVLFVGYQAEGTKGRLLQQGLNEIRIHHDLIPVEAEILTMESLSAHADQEDIMQMLRGLRRPPELILLNHGSPDAIVHLEKRIKTELGFNVTAPMPDEEFTIA